MDIELNDRPLVQGQKLANGHFGATQLNHDFDGQIHDHADISNARVSGLGGFQVVKGGFLHHACGGGIFEPTGQVIGWGVAA
jgi:hypothetical protein